MTVYKGSQKQGTIYKGSTKIGKVYKGSQLVFNSDITLYVASYLNSTSGNYTYYYANGLLNSWSTSGYILLLGEIKHIYNNTTTYKATKITSISGTLGSSGSKVNSSFTYTQTVTINGKKCYVYKGSDVLSGMLIVVQGSVVNNYAINSWFSAGNDSSPLKHPTSVGSNYFKYTNINGETATVTKETGDVLTFTKENGFV